MQKLIPYLVVVFIYLAVAADFWRSPKSSDNHAHLKLHSAMIALGLLVHGWLLHQSIFADGFNLGFYESVSAILWLTVLIYWVTDRDYKLRSLPLSLGATANYTPSYALRLSDIQYSTVGDKTIVEAFALWNLTPSAQLRLGAANMLARDYYATSSVVSGARTQTTDSINTTAVNWSLRLELKI